MLSMTYFFYTAGTVRRKMIFSFFANLTRTRRALWYSRTSVGKAIAFSCTVVSTFTLSTCFSVKSFSSFAALLVANNSSSIFSGPNRFRQAHHRRRSNGQFMLKVIEAAKILSIRILQKSGHYRFVTLVVGVFQVMQSYNQSRR